MGIRSATRSQTAADPGQPPRSLRTRTVGMVAAGAVAVAGVAIALAPGSQAAASANVQVNASSALGTVPSTGLGLNEAIWDGHMNDADQPRLLSDAGVRMLRYPGGSYGDTYHWKTHTAEGGYIAPNTSFDQFVGTAKAAGAAPIVIANYGSGTAAEAADWVTYANKTKGYGVKYWEIGNEVYGNGHYGSGWEKDNHADKSPKAYATNAVEYISAMKAVDPSIKVGVVLTTPGGWPDGQVGAGDGADWNNTVMSIVGGRADFVIVHWYPGATSPADSLGKPGADIPRITSTLRTLIGKYAGGNAGSVGIAVTEGNPNYQHDSATAGLFAADSYLRWFENGVFTFDWWDLRNGSDGKTSANGDGTTGYNDEGIVSSGSAGEPAVNTPFPPYYGLALAGRAAAPGDTLIQATSSNAQLVVHAARSGSGAKVLLINEDLNNPVSVSLNYAGLSPSGTATVAQWRKGDSGISTSTQASATSITVPPYSITVLSTGTGGTPVPAPSTSTPTTPAPSTSTPTPAPSTSTPTTPAPTTPASTTPAAGGSGALRGAGSGRCLELGSSVAGATGSIAGCSSASAQRFALTGSGALQVFGNRCLGTVGGKAARGERVALADCTGAADQAWTVRSDGSIVNRASGLCLDVYGRHTAVGTPVIVWPCTGATNQRWSWR
ncbi:MAG TPA: ricin-type beta-trefoil lectin domain protein [Kineosporiaceae bacterium]|nr:ricin-type beta-trefoil lectin domain protein [Kineosporiaceae bacterium]